MKEMDPIDLVHALNEQVDLPTRMDRPRFIQQGGSKQDLRVLSQDECWCGRPNNHDWMGKDFGAPHPRYP